MKIIDRYITKQFLRSFLLSLIAFIGVFTVSQLFRVVKYLSDGRFTTKEAILYIITLIPRTFIEVAPLAVLLGSMMTVSQMASNLEIISLKTSGVSFRRIVRMPIILSFFISIAVFFVNDSIYPVSLKINRDLRSGEIDTRTVPIEKNNAFLRGEDYVYLFGKINRQNGAGSNLQIIDLNNDFTKIKRIVMAKEAKYNQEKKIWELSNAVVVDGERREETIVENFSDARYNDSPDKFITLNVEARTLKIKELKKNIQEIKGIGGDVKEYLVELGIRYSFPFASFVISFLGLALGGKYVRGTSAVSLGICVILGYGYYVINGVFETFSKSGYINPFVAGWVPNLIFLGLGIYLLNRAE